jgi:uncharacterized protein
MNLPMRSMSTLGAISRLSPTGKCAKSLWGIAKQWKDRDLSETHMNKRSGLVVLFIILSLPALFAQSGADAPASRDDVLKLFGVMNVRDQMRLVMESVAKQQRVMIREAVKKRAPQMGEEELAHLDQLTNDLIREMPVDDLLNDMVPVYQKHLNRSDIDAMSAFYSTPTGQKLLREMPAMTAESIQAAGPRIQAIMDQVMERAEQAAGQAHEKKKTTSPTPPTNEN